MTGDGRVLLFSNFGCDRASNSYPTLRFVEIVIRTRHVKLHDNTNSTLSKCSPGFKAVEDFGNYDKVGLPEP